MIYLYQCISIFKSSHLPSDVSEHLSVLHHGRNKHRIVLYVRIRVCAHVPSCHAWTCQGMRLESEPYEQQSFPAVIDDTSVAHCLELKIKQVNAGALPGYVLRMTIKGLFCCLWIPLRCLQSWLRVQASSTGHITHACFFLMLLSYTIIVFILWCVICKSVIFWDVTSCSLVDGL
jgi:hypothetical protein